MRIGASLVLIAIGAILKFAVTTSVSVVDLATVGIVGLVLSIISANTAPRTDVVRRAARGDLTDPTAGDDVRY